MKRIAFFGGREFGKKPGEETAVADAVHAVYRKHGDFVLVHGGARGADTLAVHYAEGLNDAAGAGIVIEPHPANWYPDGRDGPLDRGAGKHRNYEMVDSGLDGAVGFPGGWGTYHMAKCCEEAWVPVWWPAGSGATKPAPKACRECGKADFVQPVLESGTIVGPLVCMHCWHGRVSC